MEGRMLFQRALLLRSHLTPSSIYRYTPSPSLLSPSSLRFSSSLSPLSSLPLHSHLSSLSSSSPSPPPFLSLRSFHTSPSPLAKKQTKKNSPQQTKKTQATTNSPKKPVKGAIRSHPSSPSSTTSPNKGGGGNKRGEGNPLKTIVQFEGLTKHAGARTLLNHQDGGIYEGAKVGILGINGAGKSTFLKILAQVDDEFEGDLNFIPGLKVGYLPQEPELNEDLTIAETLKENLKDAYRAWDEYNELHTRFRELQRDKKDVSEVKKKLDEKRKVLDEKGWNNLEKRVQKGLVALRCPPPESLVKGLSGGERRRVALCSLLMQQPDFLLLDEPTNHLDAESVAYLERFLREYKGTVVAVTHDRYFLDNSAGWIVEVADGKLYPHKGNYTTWLESKERRLELDEKKDKNMSNFLKRELEWIRRPASARQAKSRARVKKYEKLVEESKERRWESGRIVLPPGRRLGDIVLDVENLSKTTSNGKVLFQNLTFSVPPGAIVGIVGPNGCGKTTLLKTLLGEIEPDSGSSKMGKTVEAGYVAQSRAELDEEKTVHEEIANGADEIDMGGGNMISTRIYTAQFHFRGKDQGKFIKHLSGGERNRVHLAKMLNYGYNLIVLDEPTNDLDVQVLSSLEDALSDFVGSSLIVSHDRWFLDRVCTHILHFDGEGTAEFFDGNYADFMKAKGDQKKKSKYIAI